MGNDPEFDVAIERMVQRARELYGESFATDEVTLQVTLPEADFQRTSFGPSRAYAQNRSISFSNIPHRQWLIAPDLLRGEITLAASPGGVGKSSYAAAQSVSAATGKPFLQKKIYSGPLKVLYINGEDSREEMLRRIWAICQHHCINEAELFRLQLFGVDDWQVQSLTFLSNEKFGQSVNQAGMDIFETLLQEIAPDLVVIDPLIAFCGAGNMNDNAAMGSVMKSIKRLANKFKVAMLILHHTRKGADISTSDSIGGASSIVNLARRALQFASMTAEEAAQNRILPSERASYFRIVASKSNLVPASVNTEWYRLCSIVLPNACPPIYPNGDNVQAVEAVVLPLLASKYGAAEQIIFAAILKVVEQGKNIDGERHPYSPSLSGAANKRSLLGDATAASLLATQSSWSSNDIAAIVRRCVKSMISDGRLVVELIPDGRFRRGTGLRTKAGALPQGTAPVQSGRIESELHAEPVIKVNPVVNEMTSPQGGVVVNSSSLEEH